MRTTTAIAIGASLCLLSACSWTSDQIGPNDYQLSGYFDFTLKGSFVVQGLEMQADEYCQLVNPGTTPQIYHIEYKNRVFNYEAQRASAIIRFHCVR